MPENRQSFIPERKDEASKIVVDLSHAAASVAWGLGLNGKTLHNQVNSYQKTHADAELPLTLLELIRLRELEK